MALSPNQEEITTFDRVGETIMGSSTERHNKAESKKRKREKKDKQHESDVTTEVDRKAAKKAKKEKKRLKRERKEKEAAQNEASKDTSNTERASEFSFDTFESTPFNAAVKATLSSSGYKQPTEIQSRCWPGILSGKDVIAVAKTGSGKTLGFLLPTFHLLSSQDCPSEPKAHATPEALVIAPTRELACQIEVEAAKFCKLFNSRLRSICIFGGTPIQTQLKDVKHNNPALIIATPGRLCDLMDRGAIVLGTCCSTIVLDEADRMLDMGFEPQMKKVFSSLPNDRRTYLFTATWPKSIRRLAATFLRDGQIEQIFLGDGGADAELEANKAVSQKFIKATDDEKDNKLWNLLGELDEGCKVVCFANTKRRVEYLSKSFSEFGTCAVHGDKKQHERDAALRDFVANKKPLMFATDVAARGLDIKGVTHVINFDMARDVESYVHRIGRTGRAGEIGASVTFWNPDYDIDCSPALVKIARDAHQEVPDWLAKYEKSKASKTWKVEKAVLPPTVAAIR